MTRTGESAPISNTRRWVVLVAFGLLTFGFGCGGDDGGNSTPNGADVGVDAGDDDASTALCDALNCGDATCVIENDRATCRCPAGLDYQKSSGRCELGEVLADSSFDDGTPWQEHHGVVVDETAGQAIFGPGALKGGAYLQQTYELGSFAEVGPLQLDVSVSLETCAADPRDCNRGIPPAILAFFDGQRHPFELHPMSFGDVQTASVCIGKAAYGGERTLTLTPWVSPQRLETFDRENVPFFHVHDIAVRAADESVCPDIFEEIPNGGFEASTDGNWTLSEPAGNTEIEIVTSGDNRRLRMGGGECTTARATMKLYVPETPTTALAFEASVSGATPLLVEMTDGALRGLYHYGANAEHRLCIPTGDLGTVKTIEFSPDRPNGGNCTRDIGDIFVDNVKLVDDSDCDDAGSILGGSFEPTTARASWHRATFSANPVKYAEQSTPSGPNTYAKLSLNKRCRFTRIETRTEVPGPSVAEQPNAFRFFYRTKNITDERISVYSNLPLDIDLQANDDWTEHVTCLDATPIGRMMQLNARISGPSGSCQSSIWPPAELHVDQFEFTNLRSCL